MLRFFDSKLYYTKNIPANFVSINVRVHSVQEKVVDTVRNEIFVGVDKGIGFFFQ